MVGGEVSANERCVAMTVDSSGPKSIKKPYAVPRLLVYGTLNLITRASVASGSRNDHIHGPFKTS